MWTRLGLPSDPSVLRRNHAIYLGGGLRPPSEPPPFGGAGQAGARTGDDNPGGLQTYPQRLPPPRNEDADRPPKPRWVGAPLAQAPAGGAPHHALRARRARADPAA